MFECGVDAVEYWCHWYGRKSNILRTSHIINVKKSEYSEIKSQFTRRVTEVVILRKMFQIFEDDSIIVRFSTYYFRPFIIKLRPASGFFFSQNIIILPFSREISSFH